MIEPKNLLIVRTDRIGDVVLSLPLAEIIKRHFPKCRVTYLLRKYTKSLAFENPFIDEILLLNQPKLRSKEIGVSKRIGITRSVNLQWRFFIKGNPFVSRR
ncbi:MAG: hypothetical protein A2058_10540 [Ignavibacteria bacterium GWA2_36_19]|nr:MAG: hypothetical protein A2058_10540 [Ignavibacteria bacterium GWA2_36_19]